MPLDWESLPERRRKTIVLNVWGNHVFTYDNPQARNPRVKEAYYVKSRVQTLMEVEDRNLFTDTQQLDWGALDKAWKERKPAYFWTTEPMGAEFFATLDAMGLAYTPVWKTYSECRSVFIKTQGHQGIRIKRVPHDHQQLLNFCESAQ